MHALQFGDALFDVGQLVYGSVAYPCHVIAALVAEAEQVGDLVEGEAECLGAADELQPGQVVSPNTR
jgi:hypothetical protein